MVSSSVISFFESLLGSNGFLDVRSCRSGVSLDGTLDFSSIDYSYEMDVCVVYLNPIRVKVEDVKGLSQDILHDYRDLLLDCVSVQIFNFDFRLVLGSCVKQAKMDSGFCGDIDFEVDYEIDGDFLVVMLSFFLEEL